MRLASPAVLSLALLAAACGQKGEDTAPSGAADGPQASAPAATPATSAAASGPAAPAFGAFREDRLSRAKARTAAPDMPLELGPDGGTTTVKALAAGAGTPVLVNLWATWCAPCLKELPTLSRLAGETGGRLKVVALSQDMEGWRAVSKTWDPARYPDVTVLVESGMRYGADVGARGLPLTILYGPDGREIWRYEGELDWSSPEARALLNL
jgi:thiol-disulfide isomerase/thioredoxin